MKSCNCFKEGDGTGGKSQQLQFNYYCRLFITSLIALVATSMSGYNYVLLLNLGQN